MSIVLCFQIRLLYGYNFFSRQYDLLCLAMDYHEYQIQCVQSFFCWIKSTGLLLNASIQTQHSFTQESQIRVELMQNMFILSKHMLVQKKEKENHT